MKKSAGNMMLCKNECSLNKSTKCGCQRLAVESLIMIKKVSVEKSGIILTKMYLEFSPLIV